MVRLIERNIASIEEQLVLLAPPQATLPDFFNNVVVDSRRRSALLREMQLLRGTIYLEEGNVKRDQLPADGRHVTPEDEQSWHLLMTDPGGRVRSCALYLEHENTVSAQQLRIRNCPLAKSDDWRDKLKATVDAEIARARRDGLRYAELGGWAIEKDRRGTPEGLLMALATYGLSRIRGGALGITTANVAHSCSSILRRLGGSYLEYKGTPIPAYFDPKYNTEIELLRFDSRTPSPKVASLIDFAQAKLANVVVFANALSLELAPHRPSMQMTPLYAA